MAARTRQSLQVPLHQRLHGSDIHWRNELFFASPADVQRSFRYNLRFPVLVEGRIKADFDKPLHSRRLRRNIPSFPCRKCDVPLGRLGRR